MRKFWLIVAREYTTRVKKKSFIILSLLMPFLFVLVGAMPFILGAMGGDSRKNVAIHDTTGHYTGLFKDNERYAFVPIADADLTDSLYTEESPYVAVIDIKADLADNPKAASITSRKDVPSDLTSNVKDVLNEQVRKDKLSRSGIEGLEETIEDLQSSIDVATFKHDESGSVSLSNTEISIAAGFLFVFLIYLFVMCYGAMVLQSVTEEKTNRIVELMVSSVKPFQLMMGKIVGMAFVGFTQLALWGILMAVILTVVSIVTGITFVADGGFDAAANMANMANMAQQGAPGCTLDEDTMAIVSSLSNLPFAEMLLMFVIYFIGGYLLYASFFAAVGSSVNEQQDASQLMLPVTLIMLFALYAAMGSAENTNGPLAVWTSIIPLTSPIVMMIRIPAGVPLWQELLSIVLLYGTATFVIWLSGRIYRVGILMYGKKPSFKELVKWITYK